MALIYYFVLVDSLVYLFHSFQFEILHIFILLVHFIQIIFYQYSHISQHWATEFWKSILIFDLRFVQALKSCSRCQWRAMLKCPGRFDEGRANCGPSLIGGITLTQLNPSKLCEILKNTFFYRVPLVAISGSNLILPYSHQKLFSSKSCPKNFRKVQRKITSSIVFWIKL